MLLLKKRVSGRVGILRLVSATVLLIYALVNFDKNTLCLISRTIWSNFEFLFQLPHPAMGLLKGIPRILSPELLSALHEMGHGDTIVFGDAHNPV